MNPVSISIVIPVRNDAAARVRTLSYLQGYTEPYAERWRGAADAPPGNRWPRDTAPRVEPQR